MAFICRSGNSHGTNYMSAFEEAVHRGGVHFQSHELAKVSAAINAYLSTPEQMGNERTALLRTVKVAFDKWRLTNPKEFKERFAEHAEAFQEELHRLGEDVYEPDTTGPNFGSPPLTARNLHATGLWQMHGHREKQPRHYDNERLETAEEVMDFTQQVTDWSLTVAQAAQVRRSADDVTKFFAGTAGGIADTAGGGANVVGGVTLGVGLALSIPPTVMAVVSSRKTHNHLVYLKHVEDQLKQELNPDPQRPPIVHPIFGHCESMDANGQRLPVRSDADGRVHNLLANQVLRYIIQKKESKETWKIGEAVSWGIPGMGVIMGGYRAGKAIRKNLAGTKGVKRFKAAHWLAYHLSVCHCQLAMHIAVGLSSEAEMWWLMTKGEYEPMAEYFAEKISSV